jgi:ubiquinone biosynthesis protein
MEFVAGEKISDFAAREKDMGRRRRIVERLVEVYSAQIFQHGFFHADPHPGNIFISDKDEIVFIDFGICSELDNNTRQGLRQMAFSIIEYDVEGMIDAAKKLGIITLGEDERKTRELLLYAVSEFKEISPKEFKNSQLINEWVSRIHEYLNDTKSFQIPHKILLFLRTVTILEGHLAALDPDLNLVQIAKPYVRKFVTEDRTAARFVMDEVFEFVKTLRRLPKEIERFLVKTNREETYIRTSDTSMQKIVALFPSLFFAIVTVVLLTGIPVMCYLDRPGFVFLNTLMSPFFLFFTVRSYFRAVNR